MKLFQTIALLIASGGIISLASAQPATNASSGVTAPGAKLEKLSGEFTFTEGPSCDKDGNVFFTDQPNNRIMKWSTDGKLSEFLKPSGRANGMYFEPNGDLRRREDRVVVHHARRQTHRAGEGV